LIGASPIAANQFVIPDAGAAWLEGTAWLDYDWARIVLVGHTPGVFNRVHELQLGDLIILSDIGGVEWYAVELTQLATVDDVHWLMPTDTETLTLITCEGTMRRVVQAKRIK
jgi:LPXTG-site transpeptidase (sortase) family protein